MRAVTAVTGDAAAVDSTTRSASSASSLAVSAPGTAEDAQDVRRVATVAQTFCIGGSRPAIYLPKVAPFCGEVGSVSRHLKPPG